MGRNSLRGYDHQPNKGTLLSIHQFGLIGRHSLNALTALAFLLVFAGVGIYLRSASFASTPEIESGLGTSSNTYCIDDWQGRAVNDNPVDIFSCNGTGAQQWSVNSNHTITLNGMCLDIYQGSQANGAKVELFACNGGSNQLWNLASDGTLKSLQSGKCLDDPNASTVNNTQLQMWQCNGNIQQVWFQSSYGTSTPPPPTPTPPTPVPTVTHTPVPPTPTPVPPGGGGGGGTGGGGGGTGGGTGGGSGSGSGGSGSGSGGSGGSDSGGGTETPSASALNAPGNFVASASDGNSIVQLSWDPASEPYVTAPLLTYELDRSLDQTNWSTLSQSISSTSYSDSSANFGIHYYYRLSAQDDAGNVSAYSYADATTPAFTSNITAGGNSTFTSSDKMATVSVPDGALPGDVNCSVATNTQTLHVSSTMRLVVGPYQLVCKDQNGDAVPSFNSAVTWTISVKGKLGGLKSPQGYDVSDSGTVSADKHSTYDSKAQSVNITSSTPEAVAVLAEPVPPFPWNTIAIFIVIIGAIAAVAVLILRRQRNLNYNNYLRHKYYEI